jgi:hypothetical protein
MSLVNNKLINSMGDKLLNHCLVTFVELEVFLTLNEEDNVETSMGIQNHRVNKS